MTNALSSTAFLSSWETNIERFPLYTEVSCNSSADDQCMICSTLKLGGERILPQQMSLQNLPFYNSLFWCQSNIESKYFCIQVVLFILKTETWKDSYAVKHLINCKTFYKIIKKNCIWGQWLRASTVALCTGLIDDVLIYFPSQTSIYLASWSSLCSPRSVLEYFDWQSRRAVWFDLFILFLHFSHLFSAHEEDRYCVSSSESPKHSFCQVEWLASWVRSLAFKNISSSDKAYAGYMCSSCFVPYCVFFFAWDIWKRNGATALSFHFKKNRIRKLQNVLEKLRRVKVSYMAMR
jgi:hypothetical protein